MRSIAEWLKDGTYDEGVRLYELYGTSAFLKLKFKSGPNDYNTTKLQGELNKLSIAPAPESQKNQDTPEVAKPASLPETSPEQASKYLKIINKKTKLYLQLNMLMEHKHHLPEGEQLRICAASILSTNQQLIEAWALIDHYQEHQCFPEDKIEVKPTLDAKKEKQLLRQTISKAKARLKSATCRNREQTEALLSKSETRLLELLPAKKQPPKI